MPVLVPTTPPAPVPPSDFVPDVPGFPDPATWIPDTGRLSTVGDGVLAVALGALALFEDPDHPGQSIAERYERSYVGHGASAPVVSSKANQLTVVCSQVLPGRAGEQQFQFVNGQPGKLGYQTAQYDVELTRPWPVQQGGTAQPVPPTPALEAARTVLWRDAYIVWCAMVALCLGAVSRPWPQGSSRGEQVVVGALRPRDPQGGQASWVFQVQAEL